MNPTFNHKFKLGRRKKINDSRIVKLEKLPVTLNPAPSSVDYTIGLPSDLGMMLNDRLGDCTCAAFYHAIQVWTFHTGNIVTHPDMDVELLYEKADGYNPSNPTTDNGGNENHVLSYLLQEGAPLTSGEPHKIAAFVELNVQNHEHIKSAVNDCGVVYLGFTVPTYIMPENSEPLSVWDVNDSWNGENDGGHAVIIAGYNEVGVKVISWGKYYVMTWRFWDKFVDEAYAIADTSWINQKGINPLGMTLGELETLMAAFRN
jgi:hypothetical protein